MKLRIDWEGREAAFNLVKTIQERSLDSIGTYGKTSENLLIHGDNLATLHALLETHRGRVKCIYIDPPYNTGHAFTQYDDALEHSEWLNMMAPRLILLHQLLSEDGSIWISIDDDEGHYLKVLCDEIFGRQNFVSNVIWEKKASPQNDAKWLSDTHDHILVYAKNKSVWRPNLLPRTNTDNYSNPDNDPRGDWASSDLSVKRATPKDIYPITTPSGKVHLPAQGRAWGCSQEKFKELVADNRIWFGENGNNKPRVKTFIAEAKDGITSRTIWFRDEVGDNQLSKREIRALFPEENPFDTPKPERLLQRIIHLATNPGDLVLDSFLGSATTTAVAHKMGRKWIGIEMGDHFDKCVERMEKVIDGEQGGVSKDVKWQGGGGFQSLKLGALLHKASGQIRDDLPDEKLAMQAWKNEFHTTLLTKMALPIVGQIDEHVLAFYRGNITNREASRYENATIYCERANVSDRIIAKNRLNIKLWGQELARC